MRMPIYEAVRAGIGFIEQNLYKDIGVRDVANAVSYSQFYFSREFSKLTRISIYDYIIRRKLAECYKILFGKDVRIVDVAFRYGFQSHEVFTRAFRKVFGENPSEVQNYKHLAVYEPIDNRYLDFLFDLNMEVVDKQVPDCCFDVSGGGVMNHGSSLLMLLSPENLLGCKCLLEGRLTPDQDTTLLYRLHHLKHIIRVFSSDTASAFRYFTEHYYDVNLMGSNYIFIQKQDGLIDFIIPESGDGSSIAPVG